MKYRSIWLLAVLTFVILLTGCVQSTVGGASPVHIEAARVKFYHSIQELNADAVAVVRITATSTRSVEQSRTTPFTVTVVKVDRVLRGSVASPTIKLRQLGSPSGAIHIEDAGPLVQPGWSYVVFLIRFTYGPGRDTGQYYPVGGGAGVYLDENGMLKRLDPQSPDLPAALSEAELQQQIGPH